MNTQIFKFQDTELTVTVDTQNNLWFDPHEVCVELGIDVDKAVSRLRKEGVKLFEVQTNAGTRKANRISEGNVYLLITRSRSPKAEDFTWWLCNEVAVAIRKTGQYQTPEYLKQENRLLLNKIMVQDALDRKQLSSNDQYRQSNRLGINYSQDIKYVQLDLQAEALKQILFDGASTFYSTFQVAEAELQKDFPDYEIPKLLKRLGYTRLDKRTINETKQYLWQHQIPSPIKVREETDRFWISPVTGKLVRYHEGRMKLMEP
jgi:prophage antirepressor-like protein